MTKPIPFPCPHGKKPHDAYYHGGTFAGCLIHGRLLYTDIPQELRNKKGFKSQLTRILEKDTKKRENIKKKIGRLLVDTIQEKETVI